MRPPGGEVTGMKALRAFGDAMLARLVPRTEAGACCAQAGTTITQNCGGSRFRLCTLDCACQAVNCGPCERP